MALADRVGSFRLQRTFLDKPDVLELRELFSNFFPISIDLTQFSVSGILTYYGISPHFDEHDINSGILPPEYYLEVEVDAITKKPRFKRFIKQEVCKTQQQKKKVSKRPTSAKR